MKILYLIGNGFDINVGLKTSYPEFLTYYIDQPASDQVDELGKRYINRLKTDIKKNITLWSDFEKQFGKHTKNFGNIGSNVYSLEEELDIINDDIREKLSAYIGHEDNRVSFPENAGKTFLEDLISPEKHLRDYERQTINYQKNNAWQTTANVVDIISFNYTTTIEQLFFNSFPVQSGKFSVNEPVHIHGYYNNRMIMGVDNLSQIENEELKKIPYAIDILVKSQCNHTYADSHTSKCSYLIDNAQLICIYGLSFGDTDKTWWRKVCETMQKRSDVYVIIFWYDSRNLNFSNSGPKLERINRSVAERFLIQGGVENQLRPSLMKRVFVKVNAPIFNIHIDGRSPFDILSED